MIWQHIQVPELLVKQAGDEVTIYRKAPGEYPIPVGDDYSQARDWPSGFRPYFQTYLEQLERE